ncbi:glycosyltransferase family 2 protein [Rubrimonas cliftonensis]|uniref:Glycosyltransferase, GT2 family n=1 Tax=Rubrimonas cliftonensis TaxID=89524 RepID=A0A1H4CTQ6_9RHOB|nr:glycosyltransferase family 2 protein [Rubrimonas cliftonensis]SEA63810.1 Glycosyltransferase, GT2 family [Rubrimonas cliftonensis]
MSVDVSIIVVNFRTPEMTVEAVRSVGENAGEGFSYEIILMDNGSGDGSAEALRAAFPELDVMALEENVGFARANNIGAERARGEYILFLNPDTLVRPGAVAALLAFARRRPEGGAWGGRTVFADGALNPSSVARFVTPATMLMRAVGLSHLFPRSAWLNPEIYPGWRRDSEREVDVLFFCFVLMRTEVWRRLGGFDRRFFMFCEDDDLCWRLRQAGLPRLFTPEAAIVHYGGASTTHRPGRIVAINRARLQWVDRHWRPVARATARLALGGGVAARALFERLFHGRRTPTWGEVWARRSEWLSPGAVTK